MAETSVTIAREMATRMKKIQVCLLPFINDLPFPESRLPDWFPSVRLVQVSLRESPGTRTFSRLSGRINRWDLVYS